MSIYTKYNVSVIEIFIIKSNYSPGKQEYIQTYKRLCNIIKTYNKDYDTIETDSDSDTGSYRYCRDGSDTSIYDTEDERLTEEEKTAAIIHGIVIATGSPVLVK